MLAYEGAQILDVVGPLQILAAVNDELPQESPAYALTLLAERAGAFATSGGVKLVADGSHAELPVRIDTLMVAGGSRGRSASELAIVAALKKAAPRARRVVSICTGAFFLARAGLLNGKRATTHWRSVDLLAQHYPQIAVERDALYVRDGKTWTSAGVTAGMDLALALLREDFGDDMALAVARRHVMFLMRPGGQSQFSAHLSPEAYPNARLTRLLRWIPEHIGEDLDVRELARLANMSERSFARIFRKETGETPAAYVERARLDAARRMLTASSLAVAQVADRSGFGSQERMRRVFQRHLKVSPASFRARFNAREQI
ncbi:MAG: GlxA family transcriptional regulator [Proteobacteria bacterium]|nr:GlxA family transcriptional regulator [Pseudomonadota bacterium]